MTMPSQTPSRDSAFRERITLLMRSLRLSMSRVNLIATLKTLSWLVPLTLLIWIYAEREQVDKIDNQSIPFDVASGDFNKFVSLRMEDKNVMAELSGPRSRLDEIRQKIAPHGDSPQVIITIDPNLRPGPHELDTAQQLANSPIFARSGIIISNCIPAHLQVSVDEFVEREIDVQAPPNVTNLVGATIFEPRQIKIRAP
ncbi:MAG TPA: hypothetical protein VKK61_00940, partial [Tepidisphaeraceae bacterium]|nr:hypothetical protein [Tepidisphaeraceae bacterium]